MWRITSLVLMGVAGWGLVSCSITCPDGKQCTDHSTCCKTEDGYECCHYPNAVCCSDMAHCCPSGFRCDLATQSCERVGHPEPWMSVPMLKEVAALPVSPLQHQGPDSDLMQGRAEVEEVEKESLKPLTALTKSSALEAGAIRCDNKFYCPAGNTCCKPPTGQWVCCPYPLAMCCADGRHCCQYGYTCDPTNLECRKWWYSQNPSGPVEDAKQN